MAETLDDVPIAVALAELKASWLDETSMEAPAPTATLFWPRTEAGELMEPT